MLTKTPGKKIFMIVALTAASYMVFAASGGGNKKAKTGSKPVVAATTSYKPLSLRSGFEFKGTKVLNLAPEKQQLIQLSSYATVKRGNNTYIIPFKHNVGVASQVTSSKSSNYVEVRLININLKP